MSREILDRGLCKTADLRLSLLCAAVGADTHTVMNVVGEAAEGGDGEVQIRLPSFLVRAQPRPTEKKDR